MISAELREKGRGARVGVFPGCPCPSVRRPVVSRHPSLSLSSCRSRLLLIPYNPPLLASPCHPSPPLARPRLSPAARSMSFSSPPSSPSPRPAWPSSADGADGLHSARQRLRSRSHRRAYRRLRSLLIALRPNGSAQFVTILEVVIGYLSSIGV